MKKEREASSESYRQSYNLDLALEYVWIVDLIPLVVAMLEKFSYSRGKLRRIEMWLKLKAKGIQRTTIAPHMTVLLMMTVGLSEYLSRFEVSFCVFCISEHAVCYWSIVLVESRLL